MNVAKVITPVKTAGRWGTIVITASGPKMSGGREWHQDGGGSAHAVRPRDPSRSNTAALEPSGSGTYRSGHSKRLPAGERRARASGRSRTTCRPMTVPREVTMRLTLLPIRARLRDWHPGRGSGDTSRSASGATCSCCISTAPGAVSRSSCPAATVAGCTWGRMSPRRWRRRGCFVVGFDVKAYLESFTSGRDHPEARGRARRLQGAVGFCGGGKSSAADSGWRVRRRRPLGAWRRPTPQRGRRLAASSGSGCRTSTSSDGGGRTR